MSTLDPPFLELEYYVGPAELDTTVHRLVDGLQPSLVPTLQARHAFDEFGAPDTVQELLFDSFLHTEITESL